MGVSEILAAQDAGFISLHGVIDRMAKADGCTYQQAATALHRLVDQNAAARQALRMHDRLNGTRGVSKEGEKAALSQIAFAGEPEDEDELPF